MHPPKTQGQLFWERVGPQRSGRRTDEHNGEEREAGVQKPKE
jgi:hypothetical protein